MSTNAIVDEHLPEEIIAKTVDPKTFLLTRLNAGLQGRTLLPADTAWTMNTAAQNVMNK